MVREGFIEKGIFEIKWKERVSYKVFRGKVFCGGRVYVKVGGLFGVFEESRDTLWYFSETKAVGIRGIVVETAMREV